MYVSEMIIDFSSSILPQLFRKQKCFWCICVQPMKWTDEEQNKKIWPNGTEKVLPKKKNNEIFEWEWPHCTPNISAMYFMLMRALQLSVVYVFVVILRLYFIDAICIHFILRPQIHERKTIHNNVTHTNQNWISDSNENPKDGYSFICPKTGHTCTYNLTKVLLWTWYTEVMNPIRKHVNCGRKIKPILYIQTKNGKLMEKRSAQIPRR